MNTDSNGNVYTTENSITRTTQIRISGFYDVNIINEYNNPSINIKTVEVRSKLLKYIQSSRKDVSE